MGARANRSLDDFSGTGQPAGGPTVKPKGKSKAKSKAKAEPKGKAKGKAKSKARAAHGAETKTVAQRTHTCEKCGNNYKNKAGENLCTNCLEGGVDEHEKTAADESATTPVVVPTAPPTELPTDATEQELPLKKQRLGESSDKEGSTAAAEQAAEEASADGTPVVEDGPPQPPAESDTPAASESDKGDEGDAHAEQEGEEDAVEREEREKDEHPAIQCDSPECLRAIGEGKGDWCCYPCAEAPGKHSPECDEARQKRPRAEEPAARNAAKRPRAEERADVEEPTAGARSALRPCLATPR